MTTGRCVIHGSLAHFTKAITLIHNLVNLPNALYCDNGQVLDKYAFLRVLFQVELSVWIRAKQISNLFIVDLDEGASHEEALLHIGLIINETIDVLESIRNDALMLLVRETQHGVSLPAAGLSIGEYRTVVAPNDRLDKWEGCLIVHLSLRRFNSVDRIVGENLFIYAFSADDDLIRWLIGLANAVTPCTEDSDDLV